MTFTRVDYRHDLFRRGIGGEIRRQRANRRIIVLIGGVRGQA